MEERRRDKNAPDASKHKAPIKHTAIHRPRCATRRALPERLTPEQLDAYLADGWYRIGQLLVYCDYVNTERGLRGVVWTRVPLADYTFRKGLRRLRAKVERRFTVEVHPRVYDAEHEALYQRYLGTVTGERPADLGEVLGTSRDVELFDTWEVSIRDGEQLVAFSWFDRGVTSLQSVIGVYDPALSRYSLGVYTMLREIQHGIDEGMEHFYAGYILCDDPTMDYKLRTGHVEYLDRVAGAWVPEPYDPLAADPTARMRAALRLIGDQVPGVHLVENPHFGLGAHAPNLAACVAYPLVLAMDGSLPLVVGWDSVTQEYELLRCRRATLTSSLDGTVLLDDLLVTTRSIVRTTRADTILWQLLHLQTAH